MTMVHQKHRQLKLRARHLHNMVGGGIFDSIVNGVKSALAELKRGKYISKIGKAYGSTGLPYSDIAGKVGNFAEAHGYGKKKRGRPRKQRAGGLNLAGGMYRQAGAGRKRKTKKKSKSPMKRACGRGIRLAGSGRGKRLTKQVIFP